MSVDVLPGREVHHRVGAPQRRPAQLVDLLFDRGGDGGVADVRVDLHREIAADDHRLELGVIDVCRDDRAAARHFAAHELGVEALADGDELHLGSDLAFARVVQLRDGLLPASRPRSTVRAASAALPADSTPCGPLESYTRSVSPLVSAISRIGTRTPEGPSTWTLRRCGKGRAEVVCGERSVSSAGGHGSGPRNRHYNSFIQVPRVSRRKDNPPPRQLPGMDRKQLSDRDICTKFITPALRRAGWDDRRNCAKRSASRRADHRRRQDRQTRRGQARGLQQLRDRLGVGAGNGESPAGLLRTGNWVASPEQVRLAPRDEEQPERGPLSTVARRKARGRGAVLRRDQQD